MKDTLSPFQVGVKVALVYTHFSRRISQREIGKVRKDGKFFLKIGDNIGATMYTPSKWNDNRAQRSGDTSYSKEHIELWTADHDKEMQTHRHERECRALADKIENFICEVDVRDPAQRAKLSEICDILFPKKTTETEMEDK